MFFFYLSMNLNTNNMHKNFILSIIRTVTIYKWDINWKKGLKEMA